MATNREYLRQFLVAKIESQEASEPDKELLRILYLAVDGLDDLDFGQTNEIFMAADVSLWGKSPATAKRYQAHAIGYVLLLREMGFSAGDAESKVASGYGIQANALHQWKKEMGGTTDPRLQEIISRAKRQFENLQRLKHPPSIEGVLAQIEKAGKIFREARRTKSAKKTS